MHRPMIIYSGLGGVACEKGWALGAPKEGTEERVRPRNPRGTNQVRNYGRIVKSPSLGGQLKSLRFRFRGSNRSNWLVFFLSVQTISDR